MIYIWLMFTLNVLTESVALRLGQRSELVSETANSFAIEKLKYIFAFGDSYSTIGFQSDGLQPTASNPLGNPAYPGDTSSNGPNYLEYLTVKYNRTLLQTYDFAEGGATTDADIIPSPYGSGVMSFTDQVNKKFLDIYLSKEGVSWSAKNALFVVFIGINDSQNAFPRADWTTLQNQVIFAYKNLIQKLYLNGARQFLLLNLPPLQRSPAGRALSRSARRREDIWISSFNRQLKEMIQELCESHDDMFAHVFDTHSFFTYVINGPDRLNSTAKYMDTKTFCPAYAQGTPTHDFRNPSCSYAVNQYLWLNELHPTYPIHDQMAAEIMKLLA